MIQGHYEKAVVVNQSLFTGVLTMVLHSIKGFLDSVHLVVFQK